MGLAIGIVLFIFAYFRYTQEKNFANPEILFCFEWGVISFFASLRLFGLYDIDFETWLIILLGTVSFVFGSFFAQRIEFDCGRMLNCSALSVNNEKKLKMFFGLLFVVLILYKLESLFACIKLMRNGYNLSVIRDISYGLYSVADDSVRQNTNLKPFMGALINLNTALGIYIFLTDVKKNKVIIIATFILAVVQIITDGGRFNLAYTFLELIVCFSLFKNRGMDLNMSHQTKKMLKCVILILVATMIATTSLREINGSPFKHYYMYLAGDVVLLDIRLEKLRSMDFFSMGYGSFYGFWILFFPMPRLFFDFQLPELWNQTISNIITAQENYYVAPDMKMNAFVTPYYYLYADMGLLGIIFGMVIFGFFAGLMYKKAIRSNNSFDIISYLIVSQMIFKTLQLYPTVSPTYVVLICCFIFVFVAEKFGRRF